MNRQHVVGGLLAVLLVGSPCAAQSLGLGARMSMMRADVQANPTAAAQRFLGGQLRAKLSPRTKIEVSLERRTENPDLTTRVKDYPLQGSLLLFPLQTTFSPYLLGGIGWYTHVVEEMAAGQVVTSASSRTMGYHAGFGAELKIGGHAGVHGDYRYTQLNFGDDKDSLTSRFKPSYKGSMWTAGVTFYF